MTRRRQESLGLLVKLADQKVATVQRKLVEVQQARAKLEDKVQQVAALMADYRGQLQSVDEDPGMVKSQSIRRYIQNLLEVESRLALECEQNLAWERKVREELLAAQLEAKKMESLCERAKSRADEAAQKREQGRLDAAGLSQFHLRTART
jgi:flagellar export protein FliJ